MRHASVGSPSHCLPSTAVCCYYLELVLPCKHFHTSGISGNSIAPQPQIKQIYCIMKLLITMLLLASASFVRADDNDSCYEWAEAGECTTNPDFMLESCPESCAKITLESNINSIYDIVETDIVGKTIPFSDFKGSILYIVNVASRCGYTAENYETFRHLSKYRDEGVYTILAPCNQFGRQEPGDASAILKFTESQDFGGIVLSKSDVNGADTRPLFAYLKRVTGKGYIQWNFDGKFLCDREGECSAASSNVEADILTLLGRGEL